GQRAPAAWPLPGGVAPIGYDAHGSVKRPNNKRGETAMKRRSVITGGLLAAGYTILGGSSAALAQARRAAQRSAGWVTLFDGTSLANWNPIGNANWRLEDGAVVADKGEGFLVSKESYGDFELKAEFWVNDTANSGIFIRCAEPDKVTGTN